MDAHESLYLGAVAGMADHTPASSGPHPGDNVSGITAGFTWRGRVEWVSDDRVVVNGGGWWAAYPLSDITGIRRGAC